MNGEDDGLIGTMPVFSDHRGHLSFAEVGRHIPFEVRRFFTLYGVPEGQIRGNHAHYACHQWLTCLSGHVRLVVHDGATERSTHLTKPSQFVHAPPLHWVTLSEFSPDAVVLVLTSHLFDAKDYIGIWDDFLRLTRR